MQRPEDQYIKVGNINTRFWQAGDKGTPVILIHGWGDSLERWEFNINTLAQKHCIYAIDLVGFGRSDKPKAPYSFAYLSQFINDFMEAQNIERASLVGHSMGGAASLQFAIQFPDRLEKMVLVSSAGLGKVGGLFLKLMSIPIIGKIMLRPNRKRCAWFLKMNVFDPSLIQEKDIEFSYQLRCLPGAQTPFVSMMHDLGSANTTRYIVSNLAAITAPTLIIGGQQDRLVPIEHAHIAKEKIPNAELHIFDSCGHMPPIERPEEFNNLVLEFLAK